MKRNKKRLNTIKLIITLTVMLIIIPNKTEAENTNPVVADISFVWDSTSTITIYYKLSDAEQTSTTVLLFVSEDSGTTWSDKTSEASGDVNTVACTSTPAVKTITWPYSGENSSTMKIKIVVDDETADGSSCSGTEKVYYEGGPHNDNDGHGDYYLTVQIADQCWMKENLNVGTRIYSGSDPSNNGTIEKYCYLNNSDNCTTNGGLYKWDEAMGYSSTTGAQGICPNGWHIPTKKEEETLISYFNDKADKIMDLSEKPHRSTITNTSGFSALLSGYYKQTKKSTEDDNFQEAGVKGYIWTSYNRYVFYYYAASDHSQIYIGYSSSIYGYNVRCIKD